MGNQRLHPSGDQVHRQINDSSRRWVNRNVRPQANPFMPRRITKLPLLYLSFVQCYLEPGSTYQFSHHFQRVLGKR
ncbi:MAG: hypothetical protein ACK5OC_28395, partial [Pirellula sp.]